MTGPWINKGPSKQARGKPQFCHCRASQVPTHGVGPSPWLWQGRPAVPTSLLFVRLAAGCRGGAHATRSPREGLACGSEVGVWSLADGKYLEEFVFVGVP
eukprot:scaffold159812_cov31-Tisochrysis_lutea.AAC.3